MLAFGKWDSLLYGKSDITVDMEHQPLETIFKKSLYKVPRHLHAKRMNLQRWSLVVNYKKGAHQVIAADTLSKAPQPQLSAANLSGEHIFRMGLQTMTLDNSGVSNVIVENLREQTTRDPELQRLTMTVWPTDKQKLKQVHLFEEPRCSSSGPV